MPSILSIVRKHAVLCYFILAFAISWGAILIVAGHVPVPTDQLAILGVAMLLGPSIASVLMTALVDGKTGQRELFSRLARWRLGVRWYVVALLTGLVASLGVLLALSLFSPAFLPPICTASGKAGLLLTAIVAGLVVGLFEELGWTGFAIPRLRQRYGSFTTGLTVGLLWGAWHFIVFWESNSFSAILPLTLLLARLFACLPAYRIIMVWVYDHTTSLLVAILMHAILTGLVFIEPPLTGGNLLVYLLVRGAVLWIFVAVIALFKWKMAQRNL